MSSIGPAKLTSSSGKDAFLSTIKYETVAAVIRQCNNNAASSTVQHKSVSPMAACLSNQHRVHQSRKRKLSPTELSESKLESQCRSCSMFKRWASEHRADGSLPPTVDSTQGPAYKEVCKDTSSPKKVLKFKMARLLDAFDANLHHDGVTTEISHGALLDDKASFASIGYYELQVTTKLLIHNWNKEENSISRNMARHTHWQYSSGHHSGGKNEIFKYIALSIHSDNGAPILVCYFVLKGSSQWIVARNIT